MPSNYPGDPSGVAPHSTPTIACPVDADPANAASVNTPLQQLADVAAYLQAHGALLDVANTFTAQQTLNGAAGDAAKVVVSAPAVTARKLMWEFSVGGAGIKARLYLNSDGELEFTRNARWDPTTARWLADAWYVIWPWSCSLVVFTMTGMAGFAYGDTAHDLTQAANAWTASAWVSVANLGQNGHLRFFDVIDPAPTAAQKNTVCAKNTAKAWATVQLGTPPTILDGFNVASVEYSDAGKGLRFNFASPMQNADFMVCPQVFTGADLPVNGARATGYATLKMLSTSVFLLMDLEPMNTTKVGILVFGRQDS